MIPRPFRFVFAAPDWRLAMAAMILCLAITPCHAVNPLFLGTYDGQKDRPLAKTKFGDVKEKDFLLYLTMRDDAAPDIVERYLTEPGLSRREELRERLHTGLEDFAIMMAAPRLKLNDQYPRSADRQGAEMFIYPIYDLLWADYARQKEIELTDGDLRKFYNDHPDYFIRKGGVTVRVIFKRLPANVSADEFNQAQKTLAGLLERARKGEDFGPLAAANSDAPSAKNGGLLPMIPDGVMFQEFDEIVGDLEEGQISEPFRGPSGMYLVKLEKHALDSYPEFVDVKEDARRRLIPNVLRYNQVYALEKIMYTRHNAWRRQAWHSRNDQDWLLKVGDFQLTNADFLRVFPQVIMDNGLTDEKLLEQKTGAIFMGELMRNECLKRGLLDDSRLARAREFAPSMLAVSRLMLEKQRKYAHPSDETLQRFFGAHPELFQPMARYDLAKVIVKVKNPDKMPAPDRFEAVRQAKDQLKDLLVEQLIVMKELDKTLSKTKQGAEPSSSALQAMRDAYTETLKLLDPEVYESQVTRMSGYYDKNHLPADLPVEGLDALKSNTFIGPMNLDEQAVFWVCEKMEEKRTPAFGEISDLVLREYYRVNASAARQEVLNEVMPLADATWLYDRLPYTPERQPVKSAFSHPVETKKSRGSKPGSTGKKGLY
ncbi:MAG: peptidylprolyl isomerase [Candidatus Sumerlaeota bacterium]|nr:peptidylprolyl isomerase [Candidatus Sumerlaeota bacterium]